MSVAARIPAALRSRDNRTPGQEGCRFNRSALAIDPIPDLESLAPAQASQLVAPDREVARKGDAERARRIFARERAAAPTLARRALALGVDQQADGADKFDDPYSAMRSARPKCAARMPALPGLDDGEAAEAERARVAARQAFPHERGELKATCATRIFS